MKIKYISVPLIVLGGTLYLHKGESHQDQNTSNYTPFISTETHDDNEREPVERDAYRFTMGATGGTGATGHNGNYTL
jgi:hypothetical protein